MLALAKGAIVDDVRPSGSKPRNVLPAFLLLAVQ